MSFTKLSYDSCSYKKTLRESIGPGDYLLATPASSCTTCLSSDVQRQGGRGGSTCPANQLVDVDSELRNLTRPATNCPDGLYVPSSKPFCKLQDYRDCPTMVMTEPTRNGNPPCTLRGTGWNRWQALFFDPQQNLAMPFDTMVDTALVFKDQHRPCIPRPLDQAAAFPVGARDDSEVRWRPDDCSAGVGARGDGPLAAVPHITMASCANIAAL